MFYANKLKKFRILRAFSDWENRRYGQRDYIFLENSNDIVGTDLIPYESFIEPNTSGQYVKYIADESDILYEANYLGIIIDELNMSAKSNKAPTNYAYQHTKIGEYDIMGMPVLGFPQSNILLPTRMDSSLIWIKNMQYRSSEYFFLNTFSLQLWISYLSAIIFCIMLCWFFHKCVQRFLIKSHHTPIELYNYISLLFGQGGVSSGQSLLSFKIILLTYLGLLIMLCASFGAFLGALLTIKKINLPFDNLDGLLQQPDYIVCFFKNANLDHHIQSYPRGYYNVSVQFNSAHYCPKAGKFSNGLYDTDFSCEYEKLAFIDSTAFRNTIKSQCGITAPLKGKYFPRQRSVYVYSGFRFKQQFNVQIIKIMSSGIKNWLARRYVYNSEVVYSTEQDIIPIDMNHVSLILYLFILGFICAPLILIIEILYAKYSQRISN